MEPTAAEVTPPVDLHEIVGALHVLLDGQRPPELDVVGDPTNEVDRLASCVNRLADELTCLQNALTVLSQGSLDIGNPGRLPAAHALKNLNASLRHLVWQTKMVAEGDFTQRVSFLGEFSASFNHMVERLEANREQLLHQNQVLETQALTDPLTGLVNRRGGQERIEAEISRSERHGTAFCLSVVDIDHFKHVNDTYGHEAGDKVLQAVARSLRENTRASDLCVRWGGEEFVIMLTDTPLQRGEIQSERLRSTIQEQEVRVDDQSLSVTVSIGLTVHRPGECPEDTLNRADGFLYRAKKTGRDRVWSDSGRLDPEG